jgi:hypothetical protein
MWIVPKNYQPSSASALATVESSEDLSLPGLNIEQSLMWRSKPSLLPTWLRRWKRESWFRHLCGRILKPCQHTAFEAELMSSLAVIPASRLAQQGYAKAQKTLDTSGHLLGDTSRQLDLFAASLKTSKDTSASDSEKSLQTWKALVTRLRGEYSARLKSARLTSVRGCTSWPTPTVQDSNKATKKMREDHQNNLTAVVFDQASFPTPTSRDYKGGYKEEALTRKDGKSRRFDALPNAAINGQGTDVVPGHLSADWVEGLMGLPLGWTDLGKWGSSE